MRKPKLTISSKLAGKKIAVIALFTVMAIASFATLGDGRGRANRNNTSIIRNSNYKPGTITLRSNYSYRGSTILSTNSLAAEKKVIRLNSTVTLQKGGTSIVVPLKKNVVISKISIGINNRITQRN